MAEPTPLAFGDFRIPGSTYAGVKVSDPEMQKSMFKPPGTNGTFVTMTGLGMRIITVPFCLHSPSFTTFGDVRTFIDRMIEERKKRREKKLKIPVNNTTDDYEHCIFEGFKPSDEGIKQDVSGGLGDKNAQRGRWFCEGVLVFVQVQV